MNRVLFSIIFLLIIKAEAQTSAFQRADSLLTVGDYQKAIQLYKSTGKPSAEVNQKIAQAYQATGNLNLAIKNYQEAIRKNPELIIAKSSLGKLYYRTRKYQLADSIFNQLKKTYPTNPDFHYRSGLAKEKLSDSTYLSSYQKVVELNDQHQKALFKLASYNYSQKKFEKCEALCEKALSYFSENINMQLLYAQNAYSQKNFEEAKSRYQEVLNLNYSSENVYEKLAYSYYQLGFYNPAIENFKQVIQLNDKNAEAHFNLGKLYSLQEKWEDAEKHLLISLLLSKPKLGNLYQSLGLAYKGKKSYKLAMEYFQLSLEEEPKNPRAAFEMAVSADSYFEDLDTRINYYQRVVNQFNAYQTREAKRFVELAEIRISDLKKEKHLQGNGKKSSN